MAKRQLNATIDEGLYEIMEKFQAVTGLPYTRIVATALLQFLFDGLRRLERYVPNDPDLFWVSWAMSIERGEITVDDLPTAVINAIVEDADRLLHQYERGIWTDDDGRRTADAKEELELARQKKHAWQANIDDFGGKMEAIMYMFKKMVPPGA